MRQVTACIAFVGLCGWACATKVPVSADVIDARLRPNLAIPLQMVSVAGHNGVIFPESRAREAWSIENATGYWTPTQSDVELAESQLKPFLENMLARESRKSGGDDYTAREVGQILKHYSEYRRQYVGIVVGHSRRILVNSFPGPPSSGRDEFAFWTQSYVAVDDGGYWYWNVQYDIDRNRFFEFWSNGYA